MRDTLPHLELCITQLLTEAKSRDWTVEKTKHKLVEMFVTNNEDFWVRVYNEKRLDKVAGIDKHDIDSKVNTKKTPVTVSLRYSHLSIPSMDKRGGVVFLNCTDSIPLATDTSARVQRLVYHSLGNRILPL